MDAQISAESISIIWHLREIICLTTTVQFPMCLNNEAYYYVSPNDCIDKLSYQCMSIFMLMISQLWFWKWWIIVIWSMMSKLQWLGFIGIHDILYFLRNAFETHVHQRVAIWLDFSVLNLFLRNAFETHVHQRVAIWLDFSVLNLTVRDRITIIRPRFVTSSWNSCALRKDTPWIIEFWYVIRGK